ncbi:von Willebrand factor D and EGF domain-containing protein-like [Argopecten irradians]|uniref:von Willebrand factor D and EGF domain-containing protein-like n=1 Tax=Argopecten irradians TaxID=31199 RepID=UPI00371B183D
MLNFQTMTLMVLVILSIVVYTNAWSGNVCTKTLAGRRSVQTCTSFMVFGRRCTVRYITTYSTKYFCCSGWTETIPGNTECSKRIPLNPNVVESYNEVPQLAWRNLYSGEEVVDDRALSSGTYTAGKYFDMVTTEVDPTTVGCGAKRNIWLNDTLPTEDGFFHPKTVCVTDMETNDSCADSFTIEIHNGGDFRVYALEQYSHGNDSISYCFDLVMPSDPCNGFRPNTLTDLASRRPGNTDLSLGDENLAGGWYSTGLYEMLSYIPDSDSAIRCGATVQIWMNDSFPESDGKHHARKLCVTDSETPCAPHYTVIRNCGSKYVYFLTPSPKPGSVYCFDIPSTSNDPAPLFTPTNLQVDFDLEWKSGMTEDVPHKPQLIFRCQFNKDNQQDLFYVVYFSADGNYVETLSQIIVQDPSEATLSEKILRFRGFSAGIMLSCHVGARNSKDGRTGEMVKSDELYAGIKFSKSSVDIQRGAKTTIGFYTTVPFACEYVSSAPDAPCYLSLHISNTRNDNACGNSLLFHQCTVTITGVTKVEYNRNGKSWNLNQELEIASAEGERGLFDLTRTEFGITMKGETTGHRFWHNSKSEEAIINIVDYKKLTTKIFNDKRCEIYCDPHHLSFDKMRFELQKEGKFLLFKTEVPHMEVQMETKFCGGDTNTVAYCACGIVVVAGHDIFEIYTCNNQLELGYN